MISKMKESVPGLTRAVFNDISLSVFFVIMLRMSLPLNGFLMATFFDHISVLRSLRRTSSQDVFVQSRALSEGKFVRLEERYRSHLPASFSMSGLVQQVNGCRGSDQKLSRRSYLESPNGFCILIQRVYL